MVGLFFLLGGNPAIEPVVGMSLDGFFAATLLFAWIALRRCGGGEAASAASTGRGALTKIFR